MIEIMSCDNEIDIKNVINVTKYKTCILFTT